MPLFDELKRRNVFRVAAAYLVVGWLLTEVLTNVLPAFGAPDWVPRAVMLIFALGFLPAIVFSWIYEITPDGIRKDHEVDREGQAPRHRSGKLEYFTIGSVIVGIILIAVIGSRPDVESTAAPEIGVDLASVAVLPFVNMSGNSDNRYFSDGLTETLLHMLAQVPDLKVAARTSSFSFRDQNKTIKEIAGALDVAHVLEGSVQRSGDRVRITAQLIRAADGFHVWSANFDRTVDDIFSIQDEIAEKVGSALSRSLLGEDSSGKYASTTTTNPDAYDLYLQALQARETFSFGGLQAAEDLLKGALAVDPEFLEAKTELAAIYIHQFETGLMDRERAFQDAVALAEQVLAVREDPTALAIKTFAKAGFDGRTAGLQSFTGAITELQSIVEKWPGEFLPMILLSRFYQGFEQHEKGISLLKGALENDPFNARILYELGIFFAAADRTAEAAAAFRKSLEIEPAQPNVYARIGNIALQRGDGVEFLQMYLAAMEIDPVDHELPGIIATVLYELNLVEEGDDFRNRVMALAPTSAIAHRIELLRAINTGDEVASVASARRAIESDIDDRRFAFGGAVQHLLRIAVKNGTVEEEIVYLENQIPGLLDIENPSLPLKYRGAQFAAFDAWYVTLPGDEMIGRLDRLLEINLAFGSSPEDNPVTYVGILALKGRNQAAIELAQAEIFSESVANHLGWRRTVMQAQFSDILTDPGVQTSIRRWESEEDSLREHMRNYLSDLSTST